MCISNFLELGARSYVPTLLIVMAMGMGRVVLAIKQAMLGCKGARSHELCRKCDKVTNNNTITRSQHATMLIAKTPTKSFALSAINACALIIVTCCDRVAVCHIFDTTHELMGRTGGETTLHVSDTYKIFQTNDTSLSTIRILTFLFLCVLRI